MRKFIQITTLGILGFSLLQATKATGIQHELNSRSVIRDTTYNKDSASVNLTPKNKQKQSFSELLNDASLGNELSGAKLNPMIITFIQKYYNKNGEGLIKMKKWGKPYFNTMDAILSQHGLPKELKYLAVIESDLIYDLRSWAGAVGPWALMPETARKYGLRISGTRDERLDCAKSTHAASRFLTELYAKYGDWLLVIAAYNGGPGNVDKAIRKSGGSKDFWKIQYYLPNESMNHVKKFIATHYIMEGSGGITTVTKNEMQEIAIKKNINLGSEEFTSLKVQPISGRYHSLIITKYVSMDIGNFNRYNPDFDNKVALNGTYDLRLPSDRMDIFLSRKSEILNESIQALLKQANN